jgi:hypothetical protein
MFDNSDTLESVLSEPLPAKPTILGRENKAQSCSQDYASLLEQKSQILAERKALLLERQRILERSQALVLHKQRLLEHKKALLLTINNLPSEETRKKLLDQHRLLLITHQTAKSMFEWLMSVDRLKNRL